MNRDVFVVEKNGEIAGAGYALSRANAVAVAWSDGEKTHFQAPDSAPVETENSISFSSQETSFVFRDLLPSDSAWLTDSQITLPVELVVAYASRLPSMAYSGSSGQDRDLLSAYVDDNEIVQELVYQDPTGSYVRSSGSWWQTPVDEEYETWRDSLEDYDIVELVGDAAVKAFDIGEKAGSIPISALQTG